MRWSSPDCTSRCWRVSCSVAAACSCQRCRRPARDRAAAWLYALVAGWQAPCVRAAGRIHAVHDRRASSSGTPRHEPARRRGPRPICSRPEADVRSQLPALVPRGGRHRGAGRPAVRGHHLAHGARGCAGCPTRVGTPLPPRVAAFRVEMRLLAETARAVDAHPRRGCRAGGHGGGAGCFFAYELIMVSAVIQAGLALPMIVYFHRWGFSGLPPTLMVVPLFGRDVRIGFVAVFSGWDWTARLAGWLLRSRRRGGGMVCQQRNPSGECRTRRSGWRWPSAAALVARPFAVRAGRRLAAPPGWGRPRPVRPRAVASLPARAHAAATWNSPPSTWAGRQPAGGTPGGKLMVVDAGGICAIRRRAFAAGYWAKTWSRPTCGAAPSAAWMWWLFPIPTKTTLVDWPP